MMMVNMIRARALFVVALLIAAGTSAFCPPTTNKGRFSLHPARANNNQLSPLSIATTTTLAERRWNFNEGQSPWGMKENAEIWNGRVAQMAFVLTFLQELITGKGVVQGIQEGDPVNQACVAAFAVTVVGLTAWLAIKGDDDYVARDM